MRNLNGGYSFPSTLGRILLEPDPFGMGGGGSSPAPAPAPAPAPPSTPAPDANREPVGNPSTPSGRDPGFDASFRPDPAAPAPPQAAPGQPSGQAPSQQAPADPNNGQWRSIRDAAATMGFQFGDGVKDDVEALRLLVTNARQNREADYHRALGQQLAPHAEAIRQYVQQQQAPKPQAAPERQPWEAPEFDPKWAALVERDPQTGVILPKPGVPPEFATKVSAYVQWKEQFDANPAAVISQMVDQKAKAIAAEQFQAQFSQYQEQQQIQRIRSANAEWLYAKTQDGRVAVDYNGQPQVSPVGAEYLKHLQYVHSAGVTAPALQDQLAQKLTHASLLISQQAKAQQAAPASQPPAQAFQQPNVNAGQAFNQGPGYRQPAYTPPSNAGLSLRDQLARDMAAAGVTDADFQALPG